MKIVTMSALVLALSLAGTLTISSAAADDADLVKKPIPAVNMADGAAMYKAYCASCHGIDGKGRGPAEAALKIPPGDLTKLTLYHDGEFPAHSVIQTLRTGGGVHGSAEMPVWGSVFRESHQSETEVAMRVYNLTKYLESIQQPAPPPAPKERKELSLTLRGVRADLGGEMYRAYCGSCHGYDGRGSGPASYGLKAACPDLTKLRGNDGKFPTLRIQELLTKPEIAAHGSSEMPVWGTVFSSAGEDKSMTMLRMRNLTRYLEQIQR